MIEHNRATRIIFGIAFTIVFAIFAYLSCRVAPHTSDFTVTDPNANEYDRYGDYGYDREHYLASGRSVTREVPQEVTEMITAANSTPEQPVSSLTDEQYQQLLQQYAAEELGLDLEQMQSEPEQQIQAQERPEVIRAAEKGLPAPPEINIYDWQYTLINYDHLLDSSYEPEQLAYLNMTGEDTEIRTAYDGNRQCVDIRIAQALIDFAQGCRAAGLPVYLSSGYRSYSTQYDSYQNKISQYNEDVARFIVAKPGTSEHQSGLCCDITDVYRNPKDKQLAETATFKWLNEHCAEYGFILRYPESKSGDSDDLYNASSSITEVIYEPWHFRYVGTEVATYIKENDLCLEEFWDLYVPGTIPAEKLV